MPVRPVIQAGSSVSSAGFNSLSSYQNSGFASSGSNGFNPVNPEYDYKGVNSGLGSTNGIYSQTSAKPVFEGSNQYSNGNNYGSGFNQLPSQSQNQGPAVFTDGTNAIYGQQQQLYSNNGGSFHASAPDIYKKELNLNGPSKTNGLSSYSQNGFEQQNQQQNNQQYTVQSQYNIGEQYPFESARQDQYDCVCVPYEQCPAQDIVGRRDDLILPLDPRNLGSDIEAEASNATLTIANATTVDEKKVAKREVKVGEKAEGQGVSSFYFYC